MAILVESDFRFLWQVSRRTALADTGLSNMESKEMECLLDSKAKVHCSDKSIFKAEFTLKEHTGIFPFSSTKVWLLVIFLYN